MRSKIKVFVTENFPLIFLTLLINIIVLLAVFNLSSNFVKNSRTIALDPFYSWNIWDSPHYLSIAKNGYQTVGEERFFIAFFPLYPSLIDLVSTITQLEFLHSGFLISTLMAIATSIMLYKLTLLDKDKKTALFSVIFLLTFPTAFFMFIPYTESTFLFLAVSAFFFTRRGPISIGIALATLATATRITGLALIPAILFELFINKKAYNLSSTKSIVFGLIPILGFVVYLLINYLVYGDFLQFSKVQQENWHTTFNFPFGGFPLALDAFKFRQGIEVYTLGVAQITAVVLGIVLLPLIFKLRLSYGIYATFALLIPYFQSFWLSMPRYLLVIFPIFIILVSLIKPAYLRVLWSIISLSLMIVAGLIAINYGPVF